MPVLDLMGNGIKDLSAVLTPYQTAFRAVGSVVTTGAVVH